MSKAYENLLKLDNLFDIEGAYGADRTGVSKSTTAITNAVNSLHTDGGGCLYLGPGIFTVDPAAFSAKNNIKFLGAGRYATKIRLASTGVALDLSNCQWLTFEDITFELETAQAISSTVFLRAQGGSSNWHINRCNFVGASSDAIQLTGTALSPLSGHKVTDCYFLGNGGRQIYGNYANDFHIRGNQFGRLAGITKATHGSYLDNCSAGNYTENYHWDNTIGCFQQSCNYNTVALNRFEESEQEGYLQNGGAHTIFADNKIHTNSLAATATYDGAKFSNAASLTIDGNHAFSFTSNRHKWDINVDAGWTDLVIGGTNKLNGFSTSFGPIRVDGTSPVGFGTSHARQFVSSGTLAAGSTVFLGPNAMQTNEKAAIVLLGARSTVLRMYAAVDTAPTAGQSFIYTLRKNGVDTAMTCTISGAAFAAAAYVATPGVLFGPDDQLSIRVETSGTAAAAYHRVILSLGDY